MRFVLPSAAPAGARLQITLPINFLFDNVAYKDRTEPLPGLSLLRDGDATAVQLPIVNSELIDGTNFSAAFTRMTQLIGVLPMALQAPPPPRLPAPSAPPLLSAPSAPFPAAGGSR